MSQRNPQRPPLAAGAEAALVYVKEAGEDAENLYRLGKYERIMELYEERSPADHVMKVVPAWLQGAH